MHWPVIQAAPSESRKATIAAPSSARPRRASGMQRSYSATESAFPASGAARSVGTSPGITAFTRIACSPRSSAAQRVSMLTPALETQYAVIQRWVRAPAMELTLTMLPPPAAFIAFVSARTQRKTPTRFVSRIEASSALVEFSTEPALPTPAAFTARRSGPKRFCVAATAASTEASSVTSQRTKSAASPSSRAASRTISSRRPASITRPPPATIARAQARPSPVPPPVTKPTRPSKRPMPPSREAGILPRRPDAPTRDRVGRDRIGSVRLRLLLVIPLVFFLLFARRPPPPRVDRVDFPKKVGTWERFESEARIRHADGNPFDPARVDVRGEFRAPDGTRYEIPGFATRDYERSLVGGFEKLRPLGPLAWKLRFTPT